MIRTAKHAEERLLTRELQGASHSPDGTLCANGSNSGVTTLWETEGLRDIHTFNRFLLGAHVRVFSPDGKRLAVGSGGREAIRLWSMESKQELLTLNGEGLVFEDAAFSPDGDVLGARNQQGMLLLWRAPSWEEIAEAEARGPSLQVIGRPE
ncbi:MAG: hypothetical protein FJ405_17435 [Verrucomicrobia bacterium]|nr:hypothetical protein [Verrucomicrobiota bacterium]